MKIKAKSKYLPETVVTVEVGKYTDNGRTAIEFSSAEIENEGERLLTASVNLPDENLPSDVIAIKDWSENEGIEACLVAAKLIELPMLATRRSGFVHVPIYKKGEALLQLEKETFGE